jgi:hypothetical protein
MHSGISNGTQNDTILLQEHLDVWSVLGKHFLQLQNHSFYYNTVTIDDNIHIDQ